MPFDCQAIIFDLDGVLVDSNTISERHWRIWAEGHGIDYQEIESIHHGRPTAEVVTRVAPHLDAHAEAIAKESAEADDRDGLAAFDGATRIIGGLPSGRWTIATSGRRRTATIRLRHIEVPVPESMITSDDITNGKPDPEPYLKAAQGIGFDPSQCVVFEDAPAGIDSAKAAGCRVIAIASTNPADALQAADIVAERLDDITIESSGAGLRVTWREVL